MPRKASTTAPAVRIRDNQRRARARRKELIDDLKSRTRDYESQGVMATSQMQDAARKVLLENRRLRALLVAKGVPTAEIEASVHGYEYDASFAVVPPRTESADTIDTQSQAALSVQVQQPVAMRASDTTNRLVTTPSPPTMPTGVRLENARQAGEKTKCTGCSNDTELFGPGEQSEKDSPNGNPLPNFLEPISDCYCPDIQQFPGQAQNSETECSIAANILAGFRGHGDTEQARAELGCPDTARCSITNVALLHALDSGM